MKPHELPEDQQTCFVKGCDAHAPNKIIAVKREDLMSSNPQLQKRFLVYLCEDHYAEHRFSDMADIPTKHMIVEDLATAVDKAPEAVQG